MRCIAVLELDDHARFDSAIIWDDGDRLVGFGYLDGQVVTTRPMAAEDVRGALLELADAFQLEARNLAKATQVSESGVPIRAPAAKGGSRRWELVR